MNTEISDYRVVLGRAGEYGCKKIFMEKQSGAKSYREELAKALDHLREGDKLARNVIVVIQI